MYPELSKNYVGGEGADDAPEAMLIGEAPGADEDIQQRPFVGPAGMVLRQLMALASLYAGKEIASNCWVTNVVKFRPPRNATPSEQMIRSVRPYLRDEWEAIGKPRLIIPIGGVALQAITGRKISILRAAGKGHYYAGRYTGKGEPNLIIWPMVHPSYGMRSRSTQLQEVLEADWERLGEWRQKNAHR
jgi:DNA polymerase